MARTKRWIEDRVIKGVVEVKLSDWRWFSDYVNQELLDYTTYIYRGHANSAWKLEPTLDRIIRSPISAKRKVHLESFKFAARGRRGSNPPHIDDENGWWALGQHHGLATPLLDWTESPFVGLYFAMVTAASEPGANCCVWALSQATVDDNATKIKLDNTVKPVDGRKPIVEIVRPLSDENNRLVNQRGLFTRGPNNVPLETWIQQNSEPGSTTMEPIKMTVPKSGADNCLRYLNRMNINHATLFPDLYGASHFCNMELRISKY
jgi:hypothetical protein